MSETKTLKKNRETKLNEYVCEEPECRYRLEAKKAQNPEPHQAPWRLFEEHYAGVECSTLQEAKDKAGSKIKIHDHLIHGYAIS